MPTLFELEEPGFWALTRRDDMVFASQHPELFTSAQGVALDPVPVEFQRIATFSGRWIRRTHGVPPVGQLKQMRCQIADLKAQLRQRDQTIAFLHVRVWRSAFGRRH